MLVFVVHLLELKICGHLSSFVCQLLLFHVSHCLTVLAIVLHIHFFYSLLEITWHSETAKVGSPVIPLVTRITAELNLCLLSVSSVDCWD